MSRQVENEFNPDHVTPPGETLLDALVALSMEQSDLAIRTGLTPQTINKIIKDKAPISSDTAILFERAIGVPASFWINRQIRYNEFKSRREECSSLTEFANWAMKFPYNLMVKYGWLESSGEKPVKVRNLLRFFGIATPDLWETYWQQVEVSYRKPKALATDQFALAAWLRKGEITGHNIVCKPFNEDRFRSILFDLRYLSALPAKDFQPKLIEECSECGVAVAFVQELPKTASGAARWLSPDKALIQLSLRYKTDDHLWFTFFHEAGHILKHSKRSIFIEGNSSDALEEEEANRFAAELLIPPSSWKQFLSSKKISKASIVDFARSESISPGIVVGQLQHNRKIPMTHCNELKRKLKWAN